MTDTNHELAQARAALSAPVPVADPQLLGAVHTGLLAVPAEPTVSSADLVGADDPFPGLAIRRRTLG